MSLFVKKSLQQLQASAEEGGTTLKRTLGAGSLIALGIGAIIGAGLFVRTAAAAGGFARHSCMRSIRRSEPDAAIGIGLRSSVGGCPILPRGSLREPGARAGVTQPGPLSAC